MKHIELRDLESNDKKLIFSWISDAELRRMIGTRDVPDHNKHQLWFDGKMKDTENESRIIMADHHPVGLIGTNSIDHHNMNAEIYIYIGDKSVKGQGIATKAISMFVSMLVNSYQLHKINARIFSFNTPSIGLFEKCGFILEGRQRDQVFIVEDNSFYDLLWYSLVCEESE